MTTVENRASSLRRKASRWLRNAKAVSPIIAVLLMVVISVVAGVMVYSWVSGFISTGVPRTPEVYAVSITDVTVYNVSSGTSGAGYYGNFSTTSLKVTVRNPEAKDVVMDNSHIKVKESDGDEIVYASGVTSFIVYNMSTSYAGQLNDALRDGATLTSNTNQTVTLVGGRSTTFYIQIANATRHASGVPLSGALTKGNAYTFTLVDATTYDGIPVTANEKTFKASR